MLNFHKETSRFEEKRRKCRKRETITQKALQNERGKYEMKKTVEASKCVLLRHKMDDISDIKTLYRRII